MSMRERHLRACKAAALALAVTTLICSVARAAQVSMQSIARTDQNSRIAYAQLLEKARRGRIDVYFEGDSIMRRWGALDYPELLANWRENFFGWNAADFAWGGDTVQNILWRLENGELDDVHPKVIVLQAGTNNIGRRPARGPDDPRIGEVDAGIQAILDICAAKAPGATFILTGVFPRNDNRANPTGVMPVINSINERLGASADKVFKSIEQHPFVAGEFVWTGWDYLGEPTPYYGARSSYCGIIDLAGFKKDRFYLYQSHWRPDLPMAHILPHWNWPERIGKVTPVHVFTSGDEAELFLNGKSLGRKKKDAYVYRLRWDDVVYEPGELKIVAYKGAKQWAQNIVKTTAEPAGLTLALDRAHIQADGHDLCFVTVRVTDKQGLTCPRANNTIRFSIQGPGEIVATDNGDPTDFTSFNSHERQAFSGLCLATVRGKPGHPGRIQLTASSSELGSGSVVITTKTGL